METRRRSSLREAHLLRQPRRQQLAAMARLEELRAASLVPSPQNQVAVRFLRHEGRVLRCLGTWEDPLQSARTHLLVVGLHDQIPLGLLEHRHGLLRRLACGDRRRPRVQSNLGHGVSDGCGAPRLGARLGCHAIRLSLRAARLPNRSGWPDADQSHAVGDQLRLDPLVERRARGQRGTDVDLQQPRLHRGVDDDVEAIHLKTTPSIAAGRPLGGPTLLSLLESGAPLGLHRGLHGDQGFDH
mmetsp:Transcript_127247/g.368426  ORF Transcript_127247/g.368426 Transcript_127247/m.368426 type:complete len:242 (+) Transcript_127247:129-854(+)